MLKTSAFRLGVRFDSVQRKKQCTRKKHELGKHAEDVRRVVCDSVDERNCAIKLKIEQNDT